MSMLADETTSDTFWPGYVDAVTNLVLNLLFVVIIMTMAVFVFAMEMGRHQQSEAPVSRDGGTAEPSVARQPGDDKVVAGTSAEEQLRSQLQRQIEATQAKEAQAQALQARIQVLEREARQRPQPPVTAAKEVKPAPTEAKKAETENQPGTPSQDATGGSAPTPEQVVAATSTVKTPDKGLQRVAPSGTAGGLVVKFADDAIALTRAETDDLRKALAPIVSSGGARIEVVVPTGFSEAKRLGFYRAMAVRNQLIELKVPAARIDIAVREGSPGSDSSRVMVLPR